MATTLPCHHPLLHTPNLISIRTRHVSSIRAFTRNDLDGFAKRVSSKETWRGAWRKANESFEQFVYESRKTAEKIDRKYDVSRRFADVAREASERAREIDREYAIGQRWRSFTVEFGRNLPRYRKQLSDFLDTPLGKSFATIFFIWFALSGWLFRVLIFSAWVLPFAGPLLIGAIANNLVIKGECPACKKQFVGAKSQTVRCASCGNVVWQPKGDFFSGGGKGTSSSSKSQPNVIDVEFEER